MRKSTFRFAATSLILTVFFSLNVSAQQGSVNIKQSEKIEKLVEVKKEMNEDGKIGDRFVIQLFYGDNGEANDVIQKYRTLYTYPSKVAYEAPNYKVWVGNFRTRLEADRALLKIKENFPAAFVPKPQRK